MVAGDRIDHRFAESDSRLQWDGGELKVQVGANGSSIAAVGDVGKLLLSQADNRITFGPIAISGDQRQSSHQFWLGDSKFSIAELGVVDTVDGSVTIEKLGIESNASLDHDRLAYSLLINADRIATPAFSDGRLNFRVALADLDVDATAKVRDKYATGTGPAGDPDWSEIEADMLALLAQGGRLDVERLFFSNEEGRLDATARLRLEEKPDAPVLVELLLAMEGQVDIVVSKDLLASAAENNPQLAQAASMLYTAGYLLEEDEDFVLKAIYANGLLTINGLPLPLPLPIR